MKKVLIDASILGVPNYSIDTDQAEAIFNRVIHLSELVHPSVPLEFHLISSHEITVWENNLGPEFASIAEFLEMMGLHNVFSPADLTRAYHSIAEFSRRIEDEDDSPPFEISPPLPDSLGPQALANLTREALAQVALERRAGGGTILFGALAETKVKEFSVETNASDGMTHRQAVPVIYRFFDLVTGDHAAEIWQSATTAEDVAVALLISAQAMVASSGSDEIIAGANLAIGSKFLPSAIAHGAARRGVHSMQTFELCTQLAAKRCNRPVRPFGKPTQLVRTRDKAGAWRVHLTKHGAGLRLMHWRSGDLVELANIGVKHALEIEEGKPPPCFFSRFDELMRGDAGLNA